MQSLFRVHIGDDDITAAAAAAPHFVFQSWHFEVSRTAATVVMVSYLTVTAENVSWIPDRRCVTTGGCGRDLIDV